VIGQRNRAHAPFHSAFDKFLWLDGPIEERIHGMVVEMDEAAGIFHVDYPYAGGETMSEMKYLQYMVFGEESK